MNLIEWGESDPVYQEVEAANGQRHYHFLQSMITAAIDSNQPWVSESLIKAINFHAIVALHPEAGHYRQMDVQAGTSVFPPPYRVRPLLEDCVNFINRHWADWSTTSLAAYALWRINNIHPFRNGNGRTARAVCYFILCVKAGGMLPGTPIVPEILRNEPARTHYVVALKEADRGDIRSLIQIVNDAVTAQMQGVLF